MFYLKLISYLSNKYSVRHNFSRLADMCEAYPFSAESIIYFYFVDLGVPVHIHDFSVTGSIGLLIQQLANCKPPLLFFR